MNMFSSSKMKTLLFYYCLILVVLLTLGSAFSAQTGPVIPLILILPITVHFLSLLLVKISGQCIPFPYRKSLNIVALYYSFIAVTIMAISGLIGAKNIPQLISSIIFLPLAGYFMLQVLPKKRQAINIPAIILEPKKLRQLKKNAQHEGEQNPPLDEPVRLPKIDVNRRQFLKLISSAGLSLFLFSIFAKKAEAAFFGSVPGPGTIAIKDSSGTLVDPAIKTPTDGYKITQIDDSSPAYYGYLDKGGSWFIMQENSGAYRYAKGASSFSTNWTNRASLSYDYFDAVF